LAGKDAPVIIYTDGGCRPNPGLGGWGAVLIHGSHIKELSGAEPETTNNRMELTAAVSALEALKRHCRVVLHTDSEYLQKGITQWMPSWKRNGWKRREGAVKNVDLWQELDRLTQLHEVEWRWVKGHAGNAYNERCDELATDAMAELAAASARRPNAELY
jgi:ribonuclease HI